MPGPTRPAHPSSRDWGYEKGNGGSWPFAAGFILFMILWAAANSFALASRAWDPSPYILLNLFSSMLAGL